MSSIFFRPTFGHTFDGQRLRSVEAWLAWHTMTTVLISAGVAVAVIVAVGAFLAWLEQDDE